jgi:pyruvate dehydrogenase E1 component alpha subunit
VYQVKEVIRFAKQFVIEKGPLMVELMTYRYSGHSMSDPGTTYRTREEVLSKRKNTDPLLRLAQIATENKLATQDELDVTHL